LQGLPELKVPNTTLAREGFVIKQGEFQAALITELKAFSQRIVADKNNKYETISGGVKQYQLRKHDEEQKLEHTVAEQVLSLLDKLWPGPWMRSSHSFALLSSTANNTDQLRHCDVKINCHEGKEGRGDKVKRAISALVVLSHTVSTKFSLKGARFAKRDWDLPWKDPLVHFPVEPGDLVLFDSELLHAGKQLNICCVIVIQFIVFCAGSRHPHEDSDRWMIFLAFTTEGTPFDDNYTITEYSYASQTFGLNSKQFIKAVIRAVLKGNRNLHEQYQRNAEQCAWVSGLVKQLCENIMKSQDSEWIQLMLTTFPVDC
jgi:hypothetical protein